MNFVLDLFEAGVNIELLTTSDIRITCIIEADRTEDAVRALHDTFDLGILDGGP